MTSSCNNSASILKTIIKVFAFLVVLFFFGAPSYAQNTKGDRAEVNGSSRQNRFKGKPAARKQKGRPSYNRIVQNKYSLANSARSFAKPRSPSSPGKANIFPQRGPYVNNPSPRPRNTQRAISNRRTLSRLNRLQSHPYVRHKTINGNAGFWNVRNKGERAVISDIAGRPLRTKNFRTPAPKIVKTPSSPYFGKRRSGDRPVRRSTKVVPRSASRSFIHTKTINTNARFWNVKRNDERAVTTDISGKPLRTKNFRTPPQPLIQPTFKPYQYRKKGGDHAYKGSAAPKYTLKPRTSQKAWQGDITGRKIKGRNYSSVANVKAGEGFFGHKMIQPSSRDRAFKGFSPGGRYKSASGPGEKRVGKGALPVRIPGMGGNGINYSGRLKGGKPVKGGGSRGGFWNNKGNAIQPRIPGMGANGIANFRGNIKAGKPLKGGGSRSGRLWNNKGLALQPRTPGIGADRIGTFQGNVKANRPAKGGGSKSGRLWNNHRSPIAPDLPPARAAKAAGFPGKLKRFQLNPGFTDQGEGFAGLAKTRRPIKGGGSRSGKHWNNKGFAIQPKLPGKGASMAVGTFQGNLKGGKPLKGGGSVSGRIWNNKGAAIQPRPPRGADLSIGTFQGNIKGGKPVKGGGSVSGRVWNNKGYPIQSRLPRSGDFSVGSFQGNIKANKPVKGGGSVSGKVWNNKGYPIQPRLPRSTDFSIGAFQGNIKASKPLKGGGSVSGKLWNNKQTPIPAKTPPASQAKMGRYQGDKLIFDQSPIFENQGEEFTGYIKLPKFRKAYKQNPKAVEESILKQRPGKKAYKVDNLQVKVHRRKYVENKNLPEVATRKLKPTETTNRVAGLQIEVARRKYVVNKNLPEEATKKLKPTDATNAVGNLQIKVERRKYVANKNSAELALKKLKPTDATNAVGNLQVKVKQYHYIHNSSSAKDALNVREPGKAFARATDYQGNIKMKKFELDKLFSERNKKLHPDAQFVKLNKNNVAEERTVITNIKLWWAKNFRKNKTQPEHLKEREHKPRYDKGEEGLWAD